MQHRYIISRVDNLSVGLEYRRPSVDVFLDSTGETFRYRPRLLDSKRHFGLMEAAVPPPATWCPGVLEFVWTHNCAFPSSTAFKAVPKSNDLPASWLGWHYKVMPREIISCQLISQRTDNLSSITPSSTTHSRTFAFKVRRQGRISRYIDETQAHHSQL
jgi:hypothetical protein